MPRMSPVLMASLRWTCFWQRQNSLHVVDNFVPTLSRFLHVLLEVAYVEVLGVSLTFQVGCDECYEFSVVVSYDEGALFLGCGLRHLFLGYSFTNCLKFSVEGFTVGFDSAYGKTETGTHLNQLGM